MLHFLHAIFGILTFRDSLRFISLLSSNSSCSLRAAEKHTGEKGLSVRLEHIWCVGHIGNV